MGGGPRHDLAELRQAYDDTPPQTTAAVFWQMVADRVGRSVYGVRNRCARLEGWQPKVERAKPCHMCGERFTWDQFADGGRIRVCRACASDVLGGA